MSEWRPKHNPWLIALTVTLATFMEVLDTSIANVSLPHIAGNLSAGVDESTWVLTSYLVANAIVLPLSAWFSSLLGRKNYYMLSVLLFTVSSLLSGLAPSLGWLVFFRVLQGLGGGGLQPSEQAILADTFPREKLGMGMAVYGFAVVTAPVLGPTLGGWITDNFSWRWIFFINIRVGLMSLYLTSRIVEDPPTFRRRPLSGLHIDYIGLGAVTLGIAALQLMLDKGQRLDWLDSYFIMTLAIVAAAAILFAVFWEIRQTDPMIDFRMLGERNFGISCLLMFMLGLLLFGSTVLLPLFLQTLMGYSATTSGMVLSPGGLVTMACMPIVGFLLSKVQPRWLIMGGLMIVGTSLLHMSHFDLQIDYRTAMLARVLQASGLAFIFIPINTASYAFVPPEKRNQASGLINLARNLGGSVGIATATTLLDRYAQKNQSVLSANLSAGNPAYQGAVKQLARALVWSGQTALRSAPIARGWFYQQLIRQATMLAYVDVFHLMAFACFSTIILAFLLKRSDLSKRDVPVH
jgi:MFS transporter, DHA2 family, multidrug resistance protein